MTIGLFELLCIRMQRNLWMPRSRGMTQQTLLDRKSPCLKLLNHLPKIENGRHSGVGKSDGLQSTPVGSFGASWKNASGILTRMQSLETTVNDNTNSLNSVTEALEFMNNQVEEMTSKVNSLQNRVESLEKENCVLRETCDELDAYKRRWNLRVSGIQEQRGEDVRKILIDSIQQSFSWDSRPAPLHAWRRHRLGPRAEGSALQPPHHRAVSFTQRPRSDLEGCQNRRRPQRKENQDLEDLTQSTKDARNKLWPLGTSEKGGEESRLQRAFAYIDGKRITAKERTVGLNVAVSSSQVEVSAHQMTFFDTHG